MLISYIDGGLDKKCIYVAGIEDVIVDISLPDSRVLPLASVPHYKEGAVVQTPVLLHHVPGVQLGSDHAHRQPIVRPRLGLYFI